MTPVEVQAYMKRMTAEADSLHEVMIDISLYSDGAVSYRDLLEMPFKRVKQIRERLEKKMKGKGGSDMLEPGEVSQSPNAPKSYAEMR